MLNKTNIALEHITDLDMYEMLESGLRGGMCQVSHKHIKANNKYLDNYSEDIISSYIALIIYMVVQCVRNYLTKILNGVTI